MSSMQRSSALNLSTPVNEEQDHMLGPADATITLVDTAILSAPSVVVLTPRCAGFAANCEIDYGLSSATSRVPSIRTRVMPRKQPRRLQRRAGSGRCMTSCSSTRMR